VTLATPATARAGVRLAAGNGILAAEPVLAGAHDKQVAVEFAHHAERGVEKAALETELHQHQEHREPDPGDRAHQAQLVRNQIAPGERDRAGFRQQRGGVGGHRARSQKISAGSARRSRISDSSAEIADMKTATARTPASCIAVIATGSSV
jgi:hypothetical protein